MCLLAHIAPRAAPEPKNHPALGATKNPSLFCIHIAPRASPEPKNHPAPRRDEKSLALLGFL
jgi:hypothetical protein